MKNGLTIDERRREVFAGKKEIKLARKEFDILNAAKKLDKTTVSRTAFIDMIWDAKKRLGLGSRTVDQHVSRLRRKLGKYGAIIATVPGFGYRFDGDKVGA